MDQSLALAGAPRNGMSSVFASDPGRPTKVYFGQSCGSRLFGAAGVAFAVYLLTRSIWLLFAALSCVAMAWPAARAAVFNVHPFGGVCISFLPFPLTVPFCTTWVGNIAYLPFAALVVVILRRLGKPVPVQTKR